MEIKNQKRQRDQRRKSGEEKDDPRAFLLFLGKRADRGISRARTDTAQQADKRRKRLCRKSGLDDQHAPAKRHQDHPVLKQVSPLFQQEKGK